MSQNKNKTEAEIRAELEQEYQSKVQDLEAKLEKAQEDSSDKVIPGIVTIEVEDAKTGKTKTVKAGIADGFPTCRPFKGQNIVVKTKDLMKLATGKVLDKEVKNAFDQLGFGKDQAIAFIEKLVISGSAMAKIEK